MDHLLAAFYRTARYALILATASLGLVLQAAPWPARLATSEDAYVLTDSLLAHEWTLVYFYRGYW